jgi:ribosomal protein L25 (general stress protein Ctc)
MAKQVKLKAEPRTNVGRSSVSKLRARGIIPAVIYGGKVKSQALQVSARDINAMMSHASGENVLVELEIAGEKSNRAALVQEVQHSPVGGEIVEWGRRSMLRKGNELASEIDFTIPYCVNTIEECIALIRENREAWLATQSVE